MIKKLIAIFACVALISVCFTACGDKKGDEASAGSDNVSETGVGETANGQGGNNASAVTEAYDAERDPYAKDLDDWGITPR